VNNDIYKRNIVGDQSPGYNVFSREGVERSYPHLNKITLLKFFIFVIYEVLIVIDTHGDGVHPTYRDWSINATRRNT